MNINCNKSETIQPKSTKKCYVIIKYIYKYIMII